MDLSSPEDLGRAMEGVECVVHLAALLRKKSPEEIRRVNVDATQKLVDACQKQGVKRFVFVSTENTLREDIRDAYAETKREAENIVKTFKNSTIFQPCFVYGAGDTHGLGRLVSMARKSPVVPLFGGLQNRIQPVYVEDMVAYLLGGGPEGR